MFVVQRSVEIPVYIIKQEHGKGETKMVHCKSNSVHQSDIMAQKQNQWIQWTFSQNGLLQLICYWNSRIFNIKQNYSVYKNVQLTLSLI